MSEKIWEFDWNNSPLALRLRWRIIIVPASTAGLWRVQFVGRGREFWIPATTYKKFAARVLQAFLMEAQ